MAIGELHIFFFPLMALGHMIPMLDIAKLFASRGVKSTIITTPLNAHVFTKSFQGKGKHFSGIEIEIIKFPIVEIGLPKTCENVDQLPSDDLIVKFLKTTTILRDQLEGLIEEQKPNCLVVDMLFPWAADVAAKYNIPRLIFHGNSYISMCGMENVHIYRPQRSVSSDNEPFLIPNLPHEMFLTKSQIHPHEREENKIETEEDADMLEIMVKIKESELKSYGVIFNSFYELEPDYADHYRYVFKRRAWHIGPVSLCNRGVEDKANRGKEVSIDKHECLKWLDSKKPNSVVYACFGSSADFGASQLYEIALGLEDSDHDFIWVVRKRNNEKEENEEWLPERFEERVKNKGLIIRGWAPQIMILDHEAVGCFVTHCGWNSTLEGISAGVPMVTWPSFGDQFYNEKLVMDILKIGVGVGAVEWKNGGDKASVRREKLAEAVKRIMVGEEVQEMRNRVKRLKDMAKKAIEEGGSSHSNLNALLQELDSFHVSE